MHLFPETCFPGVRIKKKINSLKKREGGKETWGDLITKRFSSFCIVYFIPQQYTSCVEGWNGSMSFPVDSLKKIWKNILICLFIYLICTVLFCSRTQPHSSDWSGQSGVPSHSWAAATQPPPYRHGTRPGPHSHPTWARRFIMSSGSTSDTATVMPSYSTKHSALPCSVWTWGIVSEPAVQSSTD